MNSILRDFERYLRQKKLSHVSVKNYLSDSRQYIKWTANYDFPHSDPEIFQKYQVFLQNKRLPAKTYNRHLSSLRSFGLFLKLKKRLMTNPAEGLVNAKLQKESIKKDQSDPNNIIGGFETELIKQKMKPATIKNYLADVRQFLNYLNS